MLKRLALHPILFAVPFAALSILLAVQSAHDVEADEAAETTESLAVADTTLTAAPTEPPRLGAAVALDEKDIAARVNGRRIPFATIDAVMKQVPDGDEKPETDAVLDEIIDMEILAQQAERDGLDKTPEVSAQLMLQYTQTLANLWIDEQTRQTAIDAEQLRSMYDDYLKIAPNDEFRASHILVDTEEEAQTVIDSLAAGADFNELAEEHSSEPNPNLGWVSARTASPEFIEAISTLEVGAVNPTPVKTEFGFHVLRLDEARRVPRPDFDDVKPRLVEIAVGETIANRLAELRESADIQRN